MLRMLEKGIRGGICHAIHRYIKTNNKYMKDYNKDKEPSCLMYCDTSNLQEWAMSQKLPVDNFELVENASNFDKKFTRNYGENSEKAKYLKKMLNFLRIYAFSTMIYHFYQKE